MRPDEWPAPSMNQWLARTRILQTDYFEGDPAKLTDAEKIEFVRRMVLGLIVEATEVLDVVNGWKWWHAKPDTDKEFDRDHYIEELVDIMHFVGALATMAGVTDPEWSEAYERKTRIVRYRATHK